ncbi:MAG: hypothetical protein P4K98_04400 [Bryobacteraceae bacterium]|nr:hypothetical protein [Bryobacteraceae bacterium]
MRNVTLLGVLALAAVLPLPATTLQLLSVDSMVAKSSAIVRAHATPVSSFQRGGMIYTSYRLDVSATLKGNPVSTLQVAVPGGNYQGMHQAVAGSPGLQAGSEYVVFVWTAPSGANYIIGLSQGLFEVHTSASGAVVLTRGPASAKVIDDAGSGVNDHGMTLLLTDLQAKIAAGVRP